MKRIPAWLTVLTALLSGACNSTTNPNPGGGGGGGGGGNSFSATIDGVAWSASSSLVTVTGASVNGSGTIILTGTSVPDGHSVALTLSFISVPGTYPLGVNTVSTQGGIGIVSEPPNSYTTPLSGSAGTVTITARTSTRIAGTFSFVGKSGVGATTRTVTSGSFDITKSAGLPALPTSQGSLLTATLGGVAFNGATIVAIAAGAGFGATTTDYSLNFDALQPLQQGRTYKIGREYSVQVQHIGSPDSYASGSADSAGYLTINTYTPTRIAGVFAGTLARVGPAGPALVIQNGVFGITLHPSGAGSRISAAESHGD